MKGRNIVRQLRIIGLLLSFAGIYMFFFTPEFFMKRTQPYPDVIDIAISPIVLYIFFSGIILIILSYFIKK